MRKKNTMIMALATLVILCTIEANEKQKKYTPFLLINGKRVLYIVEETGTNKCLRTAQMSPEGVDGTVGFLPKEIRNTVKRMFYSSPRVKKRCSRESYLNMVEELGNEGTLLTEDERKEFEDKTKEFLAYNQGPSMLLIPKEEVEAVLEDTRRATTADQYSYQQMNAIGNHIKDHLNLLAHLKRHAIPDKSPETQEVSDRCSDSIRTLESEWCQLRHSISKTRDSSITSKQKHLEILGKTRELFDSIMQYASEEIVWQLEYEKKRVSRDEQALKGDIQEHTNIPPSTKTLSWSRLQAEINKNPSKQLAFKFSKQK